MSASQRLKDAAQQLRRVNDNIERLEQELEQATEEKNRLEIDVLPGLFAEVGVREITTEDGAKAKLGLVASGSLPKEPEKRAAAIEWLMANGYTELIESKVVASWSRGDRDKAVKMFEGLREDNSVKLALDDSVNHMTLGALAKRRVQEGEEVSLETLGVSVISRVRFTTRGAK